MTINKKIESSSNSEDEMFNPSHESFENWKKYFDSKEYCLISEGTRIETITLGNYRKVTKTLSVPLIVRGLPWKLFIYQNNLFNGEFKLCLFVLCDVPCESLWSCFAKCHISLLNFVHPERCLTKSFNFIFSNKDKECGFADFIPMKDIYEIDSPFVDNNTFQVKLNVFADPPRGLTWNSKKISGYVGLINQGATCYLNSLLQTLYFADPLKKIIFKAPTEVDHRSRSVVLALQYTFMNLFYSDKNVDTKKLTASFGWAPSEIYLQHDVQEMCRLLIDHIETKIKDTVVDGEIGRLLEGKSLVTIKCLNIDFESKRTESFYDIQLNVKNMKNIYESFDHYCAPEVLEGDNKYMAEQHGLQNAVKRIGFLKFPPLLHLHLLRFVVNMHTYNYEKVYDRLEFPRELRLGKYFVDGSDNQNDAYHLQSVLVHVGSSAGGHYIAFISPNCDSNWYKFDDDIVCIVSEKEAIDNNFGSNDCRQLSANTAYMLLYIRSDVLADSNYKFTESDIPNYLKNIYFSEHRDIVRNEVEFAANKHNYMMDVQVLFDDSLYYFPNIQTIDLRLLKPASYSMPSEFCLNDVVNEIAKHVGINSKLLRIWFLRGDRNKPLRPIHVYCEIFKHSLKRILDRCKFPILIERIDENTPQFNKNTHKMIFLHYFHPKLQKIFYHGFYQLDKSLSLENAIQQLCQNLSISFTSQTLIFYEKEQFCIELILQKFKTIKNIFNEDSDTESLVIQTEHDPNDNICDSSYPFKYANHFLADFTNLYTINFYEVSSDCEEPSFVLNVSKKMKINNLLNCAAVRCGDVDPSFIKIFKTRIVYNPNSYVFEKTYQETLLNFFTQLNRTSDRQRLFYQVLKVPAHEVDNKIMFNVDFLNKYNDEKSVTVFFHPNDKSYSDFMTAFEESLLIYGINNHNPLRVVNCENCALTIIDPDSNMEIYYEDIYFKRIRVEEIPDNQMNLHGTERLITVNITFSGNQNVSFHKSFFIKISPNFTFQDIVSIIEKKNIKNIVKYLFFHIHEHIFHSFPSDLKQNIPSHQLLTNLFNGKENENYIIDNATIVVEVLQRVEQSRRSMKYDPSIKIRS